MASTHKQNVDASRDVIREKIGDAKPKMAVILGSGLGGLTEKIENSVAIPYAALPGFPVLGVQGHVGEAVAGKLNGVDVLAFRGRKHFYETDDAYPLKTMIRTVKALGIETLFLSNAAGSLRDSMLPGALMMITDHINFMGFHPLVGPNDDDFGPRFPPMTDAWDPLLRDRLAETAQDENITLHEGVYMAFRGPSFETPAEIRMAQAMGGDAVGMSSVPDCIIARHCGLRVVGCSCITNLGAGMDDEELSHAHTLENAKRGAGNFERLVAAFVKHLA
ncbi:MAG: purine-nucleoside phosphorylase [Alphaproteobacteria bacterium]|nr:purine-nucleoside phosphorylase [Alphaproteobacteria bacterium]MDE2337299.1 purine-nucleoside phosphorylase [Alphaproteobacteria bacterium]